MNTRLKQFLAAENISQAQFADNIQVVRASVSHVLSGRNNPSYEFIKAIMEKYPLLNMEWLMFGKGKMYKEKSTGENGRLFEDEPEIQLIDEISSYQEESPITDDSNVESEAAAIASQIINKKRRINKIIVFFDDGSYQEIF